MDPNSFVTYTLSKLCKEAPTTKRYLFTNPLSIPPLPVASCCLIKLGDVIRPYSPLEIVANQVEFCIKSYPNGKLTSALDKLQVGDSIGIKWPIRKFTYTPNMWRRIGLLSGGTGIAPMHQLIKAIVDNPCDKTEVTLVAAYRNEEEILLKPELNKFAEHPNIKVHIILSNPQEPANYLTGQIDEELIKKYMPSPSDKDIQILVCGTPLMMQSICGDKLPDKSQGPLSGMLASLGYRSEQVYKY